LSLIGSDTSAHLIPLSSVTTLYFRLSSLLDVGVTAGEPATRAMAAS